MDNTQRINEWLHLEFGLFIHFGLYSLLGGVYKGEIIRRGYSEQILSHGYLSQADYERLTGRFALPSFDARRIARTAKAAGMRYVVITTTPRRLRLFDTATTDYKSTTMPARSISCDSQRRATQRLAFGLTTLIDWHFPEALPSRVTT